jgi:hypothetical protein
LFDGGEGVDGRIARLWYLPEGWRGLSAPKRVAAYLKDPAALHNTAFWPDSTKDEWKRIENSPYIFLSRSPLTFGHSQLVIPSPRDSEQNLFRLASEIIYSAISTFNSAFGKANLIHERDVFKPLAESTLTRGSYEKTLVLRASAREETKKEYKIHLVPYFTSHAELCRDRFHSRHKVTPDRLGGLLGWLGMREDDVDKWEVDPNPTRPMLDVIANEYLKMTDLSLALRRIWPRVKKASNKSGQRIAERADSR